MFKKATLLITFSALSAFAFGAAAQTAPSVPAAPAAPASPSAPGSKEHHHEEGHHHPCKHIMEACQAAGYYKGGKSATPPRGLIENCVKPLIDGQQVAGVSVPADELKACQARREHKGGAGK